MSLHENIGARDKSGKRAMVIVALVCMALLATIPLLLGAMSFLSFLGICFGLAFAGLILVDIRLFLLIFVASRGAMESLLDHTRISMGGLSLQVIGITGAVILIGGIIYIVMNDLKIYEVGVVGPMMIFMAASLPATLLLSSDKLIGFKDWVGTGSVVMLFVLIAGIFKTRKDLAQLLAAVAISAIVPLIVGFYQMATNTGDHSREGLNSVYATFTHSNSYAIYLIMLLLFFIPQLLETRQARYRIAYGSLCSALLVSLVFTYARAPWFGMLVGLSIMAVLRYRKMILAAPLAIVVMLAVFPSIISRLEEMSSFSEGTGSMVFRIEMWRFLIPNFYDSPVVGNGLGSYAQKAEVGLGYFYLPHNDYVRLLIDTGIIGVAAYVLALFGLLKVGISLYRRASSDYFSVLALSSIAVVVMYILGGLTENLFRGGTTQTYFWTLAGLVAAAARQEASARSGIMVKAGGMETERRSGYMQKTGLDDSLATT